MSNVESGDKILGFIPKEKYVSIMYYLLLAAVVIGFVSMLLALIGLPTGLGGVGNLAGLIALVMGLVGFFGFKEQFSALDQNHLVYLCALFGIFFLAGLILGSALYAVPVLMYLVMVPLAVLQLLLYFTGFNSYRHGRTINKDNVKSEVELALKRV